MNISFRILIKNRLKNDVREGKEKREKERERERLREREGQSRERETKRGNLERVGNKCFKIEHFGLIYSHILDPHSERSFGSIHMLQEGKIRDTVIETEAD